MKKWTKKEMKAFDKKLRKGLGISRWASLFRGGGDGFVE